MTNEEANKQIDNYVKNKHMNDCDVYFMGNKLSVKNVEYKPNHLRTY